MKISRDWTAQERLNIIVKTAEQVQQQLYAGCYNQPGTPNLQSIIHIATASKEELETVREHIENL